MAHNPYRTGLPSIRRFLKIVCNLVAKYDTVIRDVLPPAQHVYLDALETACNDFLQNTDNPRPYDVV